MNSDSRNINSHWNLDSIVNRHKIKDFPIALRASVCHCTCTSSPPAIFWQVLIRRWTLARLQDWVVNSNLLVTGYTPQDRGNPVDVRTASFDSLLRYITSETHTAVLPTKPTCVQRVR